MLKPLDCEVKLDIELSCLCMRIGLLLDYNAGKLGCKCSNQSFLTSSKSLLYLGDLLGGLIHRELELKLLFIPKITEEN